MKTDTGFTIEERAARNRGHHAALGVPALPRTEAPSRPAQECGLSRCCTERTLRPPPLTAPVGAAGSAPRGWEPTACPPQSTTTRCASARTPPRQRPGVPSTPQVPIARSQRRRGAGTAIGPSTAAPTGRDGTAASRAETDDGPRTPAPIPGPSSSLRSPPPPQALTSTGPPARRHRGTRPPRPRSASLRPPGGGSPSLPPHAGAEAGPEALTAARSPSHGAAGFRLPQKTQREPWWEEHRAACCRYRGNESTGRTQSVGGGSFLPMVSQGALSKCLAF